MISAAFWFRKHSDSSRIMERDSAPRLKRMDRATYTSESVRLQEVSEGDPEDEI